MLAKKQKNEISRQIEKAKILRASQAKRSETFLNSSVQPGSLRIFSHKITNKKDVKSQVLICDLTPFFTI